MKARALQVLGLICFACAISTMEACGAAESGADGTDSVLKLPGGDTQPPPEAAAWAHHTGWHTVCADTLTLYNGGRVGTIVGGSSFYIDHFGDSGNHAWGWVGPLYGWVYNGWFC